jgi:N-acetylmuramoyl-L-alanine amidase
VGLPVALPALFAAGPGISGRAEAAEVKIRSKTCSSEAKAPVASTKALADIFASHSLSVHPRADWGAKLPARGTLAAETPRFLLVHHTASSNSYGEAAVADQIRGFYNFHTGKEKGWSDVAYNFFVDRFGGVWEARSGSLAGPVQGDATGGNQGFSQLVCLIGDFTTQRPSVPALNALARVLASLGEKYGIDTAPGTTTSFVSRKSNRWKAGVCVETPTISGHLEMSQTSCPGDALFSIVRDELPTMVTKVRKK